MNHPLTDACSEGIDVSHLNGMVNWKRVHAAGIRFAYAKAAQGTAFTDPAFLRNMQQGGEGGVQMSAYHFAELQQSGAEQAHFFLQAIRSVKQHFLHNPLPIALDLENNPAQPNLAHTLGRQHIRSMVEQFSAVIHAETGRLPVLYGSPSWLTQWLGDGFGGHPLWVAHYNVEQPDLPAGWSDWTCWQYSCSGAVPGVEGQVDRNRWKGWIPPCSKPAH